MQKKKEINFTLNLKTDVTRNFSQFKEFLYLQVSPSETDYHINIKFENLHCFLHLNATSFIFIQPCIFFQKILLYLFFSKLFTCIFLHSSIEKYTNQTMYLINTNVPRNEFISNKCEFLGRIEMNPSLKVETCYQIILNYLYPKLQEKM